MKYIAIPFYALALLFLLAFRACEAIGNKLSDVPPLLFVKTMNDQNNHLQTD
jgi:hypothetical protein